MASKPETLEKQLGLFDVYVLSTGAMFNAGFFLLPGLAAAKTGPSVVLAYFLAALLVFPALFSKAELSTAMPRAGGTYFFLDRSLGPTIGTVGGFGTWLALMLKSAFALIGMGAYLGLVVGLPIRPVAVSVTLLFVVLNWLGARESTTLQRVLVVVLLAVLAVFIVQGMGSVFGTGVERAIEGEFNPFFTDGPRGLFATMGFVFVSFIGITKVASVPEEVQDPDRNIPLGMILSVVTAMVVYVLGISVMVAVLEPDQFYRDLTPVASAAETVMGWFPGRTGVYLIVGAAIVAFAAMANAGILSASRYPLAMARDRLLWHRFSELSRFGTPGWALLATGGVMVFVLLTLDVESVAKAGSTLLLLIFALVNLAVVVMRESRIEEYDPGFRSPFYPWMQMAGFFAPLWLIVELGWIPFLFSVGVVVASVTWYRLHPRQRVVREGAIYHLFDRLSERRYDGLQHELRGILQEKGLREADPYGEMLGRAEVVEFDGQAAFEDAAREVSRRLSESLPADRERLERVFLEEAELGMTPISHGAALLHARLDTIDEPALLLGRAREGLRFGTDPRPADASDAPVPEGPHPRERLHALLVLVSPEEDPQQHLRMLAKLAEHVQDEAFLEDWLAARDEHELREVFLKDERFTVLHVAWEGMTAPLVGRSLAEVDLPDDVAPVLVRRSDESVEPREDVVLRDGDRLTLVGSPEGIRRVRERYRG